MHRLFVTCTLGLLACGGAAARPEAGTPERGVGPKADSDIGEACITSIGGKVRAGAGLYTVEIKFQHYMKPAPFKQTVVADGPLRDKDNVPTGAGTKYDQQAEALRATVAGLPPLGT